MKIASALLFVFGTLASGVSAEAQEIPKTLPDPDGKPGDATKPVQVYILAGQSNMVGMGNLTGARNRYTGIYLTADPDAARGPLYVARGLYKIEAVTFYRSADPKAEKGATASLYQGAYDPATDYDKAKAAKTEPVTFGVTRGTLPSLPGPHTTMVRGFLEVPESGTYELKPGHGDSAFNVMELDGREVYRRDADGKTTRQEIALEAGKRYPFRITYLKGGSTAFFMGRVDLLGKGDLEIVTKRDGKFPNLVDDEGFKRTFSMIHADLHPHNVLVEVDRLHVIDFDDAGFGWHHYEFAVALTSYTDHSDFEVIRDEMLAGYRTERAFPDSDAALLPMFLLVRELVILGWHLERPEYGRGERMIQRACSSAEAFLS